jgi:hypothetical protein
MRRRTFLAAIGWPLAPQWLLSCARAGEPATFEPSEFFRAEARQGVWWLVDPAGRPIVSLGVNHLEPRLMLAAYNRQATLERYGADFVTANGAFNPEGTAAKNWVDQILRDLRDWGFNTLGFHNSLPRPLFRDRIYFCEPVRPIVTTPYFPNAERPDVFSAEVAARIEKGARDVCTAYRDDLNLLGYIYNDRPIYAPGGGPGGSRLPWHPWVEALLRLPATAPGKQKWMELLKARHADAKSAAATHGLEATGWDDLLSLARWPAPREGSSAEADHRGFLALIVEQWYRLHWEAIRRHDPNHLILGDKLGGGFSEPGTRAAAHRNIPPYLYAILKKYVDVVTVEWYGRFEEQATALENIHQATGKPVILGDSSFSALQPRQQDCKGVKVGSQKEVGDEYARYLRQALEKSFIVGWHFCGYIESWTEPGRPSRFAPQNGFKDPFEHVHEEAIVRVRAANRQAQAWHEQVRR